MSHSKGPGGRRLNLGAAPSLTTLASSQLREGKEANDYLNGGIIAISLRSMIVVLAILSSSDSEHAFLTT